MDSRLAGLSDDWENISDARSRLRESGSLFVWQDEDSVGAITIKSVELNYELLLPCVRRLPGDDGSMKMFKVEHLERQRPSLWIIHVLRKPRLGSQLYGIPDV